MVNVGELNVLMPEDEFWRRYQSLALRTESPRLVAGVDTSLWRLLHATLGIAGELVELDDAISRIAHDYRAHEEVSEDELRGELGDLLWYVALGFSACRMEMADYAECQTVIGSYDLGQCVDHLRIQTASLVDAAKRLLFYKNPQSLDGSGFPAIVVRLSAIFETVRLIAREGEWAFHLADELQCDPVRPRAIALANIAKLQKRYPDKFTEQRALNRNTDAEFQAIHDAGAALPPSGFWDWYGFALEKCGKQGAELLDSNELLEAAARRVGVDSFAFETWEELGIAVDKAATAHITTQAKSCESLAAGLTTPFDGGRAVELGAKAYMPREGEFWETEDEEGAWCRTTKPSWFEGVRYRLALRPSWLGDANYPLATSSPQAADVAPCEVCEVCGDTTPHGHFTPTSRTAEVEPTVAKPLTGFFDLANTCEVGMPVLIRDGLGNEIRDCVACHTGEGWVECFVRSASGAFLEFPEGQLLRVKYHVVHPIAVIRAKPKKSEQSKVELTADCCGPASVIPTGTTADSLKMVRDVKSQTSPLTATDFSKVRWGMAIGVLPPGVLSSEDWAELRQAADDIENAVKAIRRIAR